MTEASNGVVIKKYANRRLYNTGTSTYVTLEDLARMVKRGEDFLVCDAKTGEDITRSVLTQIIFDAEAKGNSLLPITFLRQLIRFYDDSMQHLVPPYLDHALAAFTSNRDKLMAFTGANLGAAAVGALEEQARRNMELFHKSMRMFMPVASDTPAKPEGESAAPADPATSSEGPTWRDFEAMRAELQSMQARMDALVGMRAPQASPAGLAEPDPAPLEGNETGATGDTAVVGAREEAKAESDAS